jgi:hypothetical protein
VPVAFNPALVAVFCSDPSKEARMEDATLTDAEVATIRAKAAKWNRPTMCA